METMVFSTYLQTSPDISTTRFSTWAARILSVGRPLSWPCWRHGAPKESDSTLGRDCHGSCALRLEENLMSFKEVVNTMGKNMTTDVHLTLGSKCLELQETITTFPFESVLARKGNTSSYCGGWWHPLFTVPSGNQTWLAGKSPISGGLNVRKSPINCGFSIAVVPDRRVNVLIFGYSGKTPMYGSKARSSGFFLKCSISFRGRIWSVLI